MSGLRPLFSSGKDDWQTPLSVFLPLDTEFGFTLDVAADRHSTLCDWWLGPQSEIAEDALTISWEGPDVCWCNPPYSRVKLFVAKAAAERLRGTTTVLLLPSRTDTRWWHDHVWDRDTHTWRPGVEGRFCKGRIKFVDPSGWALRKGTTNSAPFPSVVVVFRGVRVGTPEVT